MKSLEFMECLFETKPEKDYILLWQVKTKRSVWFKDLMHAANHIDNNQNDLYHGVGTSPQNFGAKKRCQAKDISGIPGFYADIDIGEKPSGKKYPPDLESAIALTKGHGLDPTLIVHTGGGIHAYWLFKELWSFESSDERMQAANLNQRLCMMLKNQAKKNDSIIDSVFDLSRVLRPVGTLNCKGDQPLPVQIIENNGPRYSDAEIFEDILPLLGQYEVIGGMEIPPEELKKIEKVLKLKNVAAPPAEALDMLIDVDVDFKAAWNNRKSDKKDTSPSGIHWTLSCIAVRNRWTDQEIADLLVAWNRRHGIPLDKVMRPDYIGKTIGRARIAVSGQLAEEYTKDITEISRSSIKDSMPETLKKKSLEVLNHHCGFKILRIIKYVQEKKMKYRMELLNGGVVYFSGQDQILSRIKFIQQVFATTNKALSITNNNWEKMKRAFEHVIEDVVVSSQSNVETRIRAWVREYLEGQKVRNQNEAARDDLPFIHGGFWYLFPVKFKSWCFQNKLDRESVDKTELDLTIIGSIERRFNPQHPDSEDPKKRIKKLPWKIPHDVLNPDI